MLLCELKFYDFMWTNVNSCEFKRIKMYVYYIHSKLFQIILFVSNL
jgi:hypothetical protein